MFREMRRFKQQLSQEECIQALNRATAGVLAVAGDDGYPYAVPLSYIYHDGKIFFHCAKTGHKLDGIARSEKVSFCVIDQDQVVPEEYTTYFRSVIAFGKARVLPDGPEKAEALALLSERYTPGDPEGRLEEMNRHMGNLAMVEINIEHMTGKEAKELAQQKDIN